MRRSLVIGALVRPEVSIVSPILFYFILFFFSTGCLAVSSKNDIQSKFIL